MNQPATYILWLPSWYPNKLQPLNGDFVQRHAVSASLYNRIEVIHVVKDEKGLITKSILTDVSEKPGLRETIVYYYSTNKFPKVVNRWLSHRKYKKIYKQTIRSLVANKGQPSLVHVYIALKAGIIGRWFSKKFGCPYVVTEQATIYLEEAKPHLKDEPVFFQHAAAEIFKDAGSVMAVSEYLLKALKSRFELSNSVVIPNVVNEDLFSPSDKKASVEKHFMHVSNLNYQKNPEAILEAFSLVKKAGHNFHLDIVGPEIDALKEQQRQLQLDDEVAFHHEMPQQQLAALVAKSDALILYSRYETFGCVIIEALAAGVPVILSDIPVHHENADHSNALFAANENSRDLAQKIIHLIKGDFNVDHQQISQATINHYNYKKVGKQLHNWYQEVLSKKKGS